MKFLDFMSFDLRIARLVKSQGDLSLDNLYLEVVNSFNSVV